MSLDNPIKLYRNPCETIGSGKCREYSNGIDLETVTLRRCRTSRELVPQCSLLLAYGRETHSQKPWTITLCGNWVELGKGRKQRRKIRDEKPSDPQRRMTQELGRKSPAHCTGGSSGYKTSPRRIVCVREEAHGIPYQEEARNGEGKKMMLHLFKG